MLDAADATTYSIGEVALAVGLSVHALRFYEREDLLIGAIERTSGGRRRYGAIDVKWLQICIRLRAVGMPLSDLKRYAALVRQGPGNERERLALLHEQRDRIEKQFDALEQVRRTVERKIEVYEAHLTSGDAAPLWDPTVG